MFNIGDLIVYGENGVCRVDGLEARPFGGENVNSYRLSPLYSSCVIYTPVENPTIFMRPVLEKRDAEELIAKINELETDIFYSSVPRELIEKYDAIIKQHDAKTLAVLVHSIRVKRDILLKQRKKLSAIDERYLKKASDLLFGELAAVLGISRDEAMNKAFGK